MIRFWNDKDSWIVFEQGMYSDNTPFIKVPWFWDAVKEATGVTLKVDSILELFTGLAMVKGIRNQKTNADPELSTLVLPYIPGARQDRVNPTGDVLHSLAMVGDMINAQGFKRVIAADPHSINAFHYINNLEGYALSNIYAQLPDIYNGVIVPDKGAKDRAELAASVLGLPIFYG